MPAESRATDEEAFLQLFQTEHGYVYRTLLRLGVQRRDAEDLVQEVFLAVHRQWGAVDRTRPMRPWLFAFAYRQASNYRRLARHRHPLDGESEQAVASTPTPERVMQASEARALVLKALQAVPEERRALFIACELDGFSTREAAEALSIPEGTARWRLQTARDEVTVAVRRLRGGSHG